MNKNGGREGVAVEEQEQGEKGGLFWQSGKSESLHASRLQRSRLDLPAVSA
jgi:hypothetical protein